MSPRASAASPGRPPRSDHRIMRRVDEQISRQLGKRERVGVRLPAHVADYVREVRVRHDQSTEGASTDLRRRPMPSGRLDVRSRAKRLMGAALPIVLALVGAGPLEAQRGPCDDHEGFQRLDFWLGEWVVYVGERRVGTNRIEKILAGCAIMEHWTDAGGGEGKSLFFYNPTTDHWKQVWVTQDATRPGGLKEKELIERFESGAVRFQGEIPLPGDRSYLDRTTLTPLPDGSVTQVIEVSRDGGQSWDVSFDARYVRAEGEQRD